MHTGWIIFQKIIHPVFRCYEFATFRAIKSYREFDVTRCINVTSLTTNNNIPDMPLRRNNRVFHIAVKPPILPATLESARISLKPRVIYTRTGNVYQWTGSDIFSGVILVKDSDNSCESRLREQLFCRNKLINPVLSARKLQYDVLSFENRY